MLKLSTYGPRIAPKPITRSETPQIYDITEVGSYPINESISVLFSERIVLTPSFSVYDESSDTTCKIRVEFYDKSNRFLGVSPEITLIGYDVPFLDDMSRYSATLYVLANEMGASYIKIRLIEKPTNNANLRIFISST